MFADYLITVFVSQSKKDNFYTVLLIYKVNMVVRNSRYYLNTSGAHRAVTLPAGPLRLELLLPSAPEALHALSPLALCLGEI